MRTNPFSAGKVYAGDGDDDRDHDNDDGGNHDGDHFKDDDDGAVQVVSSRER